MFDLLGKYRNSFIDELVGFHVFNQYVKIFNQYKVEFFNSCNSMP